MPHLSRLKSTFLCFPLALCLACGAADERPTGHSSQPIIGGTPSTLGQLYATVSLYDVNTAAQACTGTLIAPTVIVTAAHCVVTQDEQTNQITYEFQPTDLLVIAGDLDGNTATQQNAWDVASITRHTLYNGDNGSDPDGLAAWHDIAVLTTTEGVDAVTPAAVLPLTSFDQAVQLNPNILLAGYGSRDQQGNEFGVLYQAQTPYQRRNDNEFIAGGAGNPDTCPGDSGGPAYADIGGALWLAGATSRGVSSSSATCGEGGIYTLVGAYSDFIANASGGAWVPSAPPNFGSAGSGSGGATGSGGSGTAGAAGTPANPGGSGDSGGCSTAPSALPPAGPLWLGLTMALALGLRRRRS